MSWARRTTALILGAASTATMATPAMAATVDYNLNGPAGVVHTEKASGDVTVETIGVDFDGLGDLLGWNTKADGTGITYNVGDKVAADAVLYAQYSDHTMLASGLTQIDGKTYYYADSEKKTGIVNVGGKLMYFDPADDGALVTSKWFDYDGKTYYADGEGVLKANQMTEIGGKKYVFGADGALATGFVTISGKTYYAGGEATSDAHAGYVVTGSWVTKDGKKAFATPDGSLATGIISINGMSHMFGADGIAVSAGWHETGLSDVSKAWCETTGDNGLIVTWSRQNDSLLTTFAGWPITEETRTELLKLDKDKRDAFEVFVAAQKTESVLSFNVSSVDGDRISYDLVQADGPYQYDAKYVDGAWVPEGVVIPPAYMGYPGDVYTKLYANFGVRQTDLDKLDVLSSDKSSTLENAIAEFASTNGLSNPGSVRMSTIDDVSVYAVGAEVKPSVGDIVKFTATTGWHNEVFAQQTACVATYTSSGWVVEKDNKTDPSDKKDDKTDTDPSDKKDDTDKKDDKTDTDPSDKKDDKTDTDPSDKKDDTDKKDDKTDTDPSDKKDDTTVTFAGMAVTMDKNVSISLEDVKLSLGDAYQTAESTFEAWMRGQGIDSDDYELVITNFNDTKVAGVRLRASVDFTLKPTSGEGKSITGTLSCDGSDWSVTLTGAKDTVSDDDSDTNKDGSASDGDTSGKSNANTADEVKANVASSDNEVTEDASQATPKDKATLQTGIDSFAMPTAIVAIGAAVSSVVAVIRRRQREE